MQLAFLQKPYTRQKYRVKNPTFAIFETPDKAVILCEMLKIRN